jgi:hypothetical protein
MLLSVGLFGGVLGITALPDGGELQPTDTSVLPPDTTVVGPGPSAPDTTVAAPDTTVPEATTTTVGAPVETTVPDPGDTTTVPGGGDDTSAPVTTVPAGDTAPAGDAPTDDAASDDATEPDAPVITPTTPNGGWPLRMIRFPVAGPVTYGDDWGDCRDDCARHHIGNDLIGNRLQPLLAATDGTITHFVENHPTAGWGIVITDAQGWEYRYYHVNNDAPGTDDGSDPTNWRFPEGIVLGATVKAGQVVAFMGDSGNSEYSVPHVHFEIHQPDGTAVNPYPSLRSAELIDRCANVGDLYRNALFPQPSRSTATLEVPTVTGKGSILIGIDGTYVPSGDAVMVGNPAHTYDGFSCDQGGSIVSALVCSDEAAILATIRQMESGGNYLAKAAKASASGAYQFIDSTWGNYGGFTSAWLAPPAVQDAKALQDVRAFLATYGDIAKIPVGWYWPRALSHPEDMDIVPHPEAGNRLTVRQYQQRWLAEYAAHQAINGTCG